VWHPAVSIVIPVYGSSDSLGDLVRAIHDVYPPADGRAEVILVNDASPDDSWKVVTGLCRTYPNVVGIDLRRNTGQDNAILTGLRFAHGRQVAVMDDDLQHHPRDLPRLFDALDAGADVAFAAFTVRRHRLWKPLGSRFNGACASLLLGKPKGVYLSPFKALGREVVDQLCTHRGPHTYIDALVLQATSRIAQVPVEHHPRRAGRSTYTFRKSVGVWERMVFSGSDYPPQLALAAGAVLTAAGVITALVSAGAKLFGAESAGWAIVVAVQFVVGGVQLLNLWIAGGYAYRAHRTLVHAPEDIREVLNSEGPVAVPGSTAA
jgi:undecaprenyl-phosphate 4-deoxy-4-formamido-L-arabinose transferase